jgi:hypothetical protein
MPAAPRYRFRTTRVKRRTKSCGRFRDLLATRIGHRDDAADREGVSRSGERDVLARHANDHRSFAHGCDPQIFQPNLNPPPVHGEVLIWNDRVKSACFVRSLHPFQVVPRKAEIREDAALVAAETRSRRLITLIFAGRHRIVMIRRELPRTNCAGRARKPAA